MNNDIDQWGNYKDSTYDKYAQYQMYREKQREHYFADEEVVSVEEYEYQVGKRDKRIQTLETEALRAVRLQAELDNIRSALYVAGVLHDRDEVVPLSEKITWLLERQRYRINELGLQVDDDA